MRGFDTVGFWKRTMAFVFDLLVINLIIFYPFQKVFTSYMGAKSSIIALGESSLPSKILFTILMISILALLYFTFFEYYLSQTLGQMLLEIKVVSLTSDELSFWKSILRNCFILPFFPFYLFWFVEPLHMAFYKDRFLERITQTRTIAHKDYKNYLQGYRLQKV